MPISYNVCFPSFNGKKILLACRKHKIDAAILVYESSVQLIAVHSVIEKKLYNLPNMVYNTFFLISFTDTNHSIMLAFLDSCTAIYTSSDILQRELTQNVPPKSKMNICLVIYFHNIPSAT